MKIAILYICTGKYSQFWKDFYHSSEHYFLTQTSKQYFVFTDDENIIQHDNMNIIYKKNRGFPLDSLFRFEMFLEIEERLNEYDYIYFFNSNMKFVSEVGNEILPTWEDDGGLIAVLHPGFFDKDPRFYTYERNKKSLAYIKRDKKLNYYYYMGGLNGGISSEYLKLIRVCAENIRTDYNNNIIAVFHDESHLNKYLVDKKCLRLSPAYGYPEGWNLNFEIKVLIRDKVKIDKYFDKKDHSLFGKVKRTFLKLHRVISPN